MPSKVQTKPESRTNGNHNENQNARENATANAKEETQAQQTAQQTVPTGFEEIEKIIERVRREGMSASEWVSERIIESDFAVVTVSSQGGAVSLWIKPRTLRNGFPIPLDSQIAQRIEDLEWVVSTLKQLLPILQKYANGTRRTTVTSGGIIIRKRF